LFRVSAAITAETGTNGRGPRDCVPLAAVAREAADRHKGIKSRYFRIKTSAATPVTGLWRRLCLRRRRFAVWRAQIYGIMKLGARHTQRGIRAGRWRPRTKETAGIAAEPGTHPRFRSAVFGVMAGRLAICLLDMLRATGHAACNWTCATGHAACDQKPRSPGPRRVTAPRQARPA